MADGYAHISKVACRNQDRQKGPLPPNIGDLCSDLCLLLLLTASSTLSLLLPTLYTQSLTTGVGDTGAARYGCWGEQEGTSPTGSRQLAVEVPGGKAGPASIARTSDFSIEG